MDVLKRAKHLCTVNEQQRRLRAAMLNAKRNSFRFYINLSDGLNFHWDSRMAC